MAEDIEFVRRFETACDGNPNVPPINFGRLTYIQREFKERFGLKLSVESVRRWMSGIAVPRRDKMEMLAQILGVDVAWLQMGVDPSLSGKERKLRNAMADGAVNLVAGLIQMDGGHPAFPAADDKRAADGHVDLYAIIRGANYLMHIVLGVEEDGDVRFTIPVGVNEAIVLGVLKQGFSVRIFELTDEAIATGKRNGGSLDMLLGDLEGKVREITSFAGRL